VNLGHRINENIVDRWRLRWTGAVAVRGLKINTCRIMNGKPERKRKPARPGYRKTQLALDKDK